MGAGWNYASPCTYVFLSLLLAWAQLRWWQASLLCLVGFGSYILQPSSCFHSMFSHFLLVWLHSVAGLHKQPLDIATEGREGVGLTLKCVWAGRR